MLAWSLLGRLPLGMTPLALLFLIRGEGKGYGAALMREAAAAGRKMGLAGLQVTVRGGQGVEAFYAKLGYSEVGRLPGALRIADGDDRDEILMWLPLA